MPRNLSKHDNNQMTLIDTLSRSEIVFYHRTPETSDRVRYQSRKFRRDGNTMINCTRTALIDAAESVLTGIRDGDFTVTAADGAEVIVSSNPESPFYNLFWKEMIRDMAGDLLFLLGHSLFEGELDVGVLSKMEFVSEGEPIDEPERATLPPLVNSSGG